MSEQSNIVEHLKMTQGVINRLAGNSFSLKGWSMTLIVAAFVFLSRNESANENLLFALFLPVIGFWFLDSYYLWQERLFRQVYNDARTKTETDFVMNPMVFLDRPKCCRLASFFSETLVVFYGIELLAVGVVIFIIKLA